MRVLVSGASGFVGRKIVVRLEEAGHEIVRLVRQRDLLAPNAVYWNPLTGNLEGEALDGGVDGVVHLAGESVFGYWTQGKKDRIYASRVQGTRHLVEALKRLPDPPKVFVCASAVGFYGDAGDEVVDETSPQGKGFLAHVAEHWEQAALLMAEKKTRVVSLRFGIILGESGGALAQMRVPFSFGLGGVLGSGKQYMSWVSLEDVVGLIEASLSDERYKGPVNAVSPNPVTNREFTKTLGKVLRRPTFFWLPAFVLKGLLGQMAKEMLLFSTRVKPTVALKNGYEFKHPKLEDTLRDTLL